MPSPSRASHAQAAASDLGPAETLDPMAHSRIEVSNPVALIYNPLKLKGVSLLSLSGFRLREQFPIDVDGLDPIQPGRHRLSDTLTLDFEEIADATDMQSLPRSVAERVYVVIPVVWIDRLPKDRRREGATRHVRHFLTDVQPESPILRHCPFYCLFLDGAGVQSGSVTMVESHAFTKMFNRAKRGQASENETMADHIFNGVRDNMGLSAGDFGTKFRAVTAATDAPVVAGALTVLAYASARSRHARLAMELRASLAQRNQRDWDLAAHWDREERMLFNALRFGELTTAVTNMRAVLVATQLADSDAWCERMCRGANGFKAVFKSLKMLMLKSTSDAARELRVYDQAGQQQHNLLTLLVYFHELQLVLLILAGERDRAINAFKRNAALVLTVIGRGFGKRHPDARDATETLRINAPQQVAIAFLLTRSMRHLLHCVRPRAADPFGRDITDLFTEGDVAVPTATDIEIAGEVSRASSMSQDSPSAAAAGAARSPSSAGFPQQDFGAATIQRRYQNDIAGFTLLYRKAFVDLAVAVGVSIPTEIRKLSGQGLAFGALRLPEVKEPMRELRVMLFEDDPSMESTLCSTQNALGEVTALTTAAASTFHASGRERFALLIIRELAIVMQTTNSSRSSELLRDRVLTTVQNDGAWPGLHADALRHILRCHVCDLESAESREDPELIASSREHVIESLLDVIACTNVASEKSAMWDVVIRAAKEWSQPMSFAWSKLFGSPTVIVRRVALSTDEGSAGSVHLGDQTTEVREGEACLFVVSFPSAVAMDGDTACVRLILASERAMPAVEGDAENMSASDGDLPAEPLYVLEMTTREVTCQTSVACCTGGSAIHPAWVVTAEFSWVASHSGDFLHVGTEVEFDETHISPIRLGSSAAGSAEAHAALLGAVAPVVSVPDASIDVVSMSVEQPKPLHFFGDPRAALPELTYTIKLRDYSPLPGAVARWIDAHRSTGTCGALDSSFASPGCHQGDSAWESPPTSVPAPVAFTFPTEEVDGQDDAPPTGGNDDAAGDGGEASPLVRLEKALSDSGEGPVGSADRSIIGSKPVAFVVLGGRALSTSRGKTRVRSWLRRLIEGRSLAGGRRVSRMFATPGGAAEDEDGAGEVGNASPMTEDTSPTMRPARDRVLSFAAEDSPAGAQEETAPLDADALLAQARQPTGGLPDPDRTGHDEPLAEEEENVTPLRRSQRRFSVDPAAPDSGHADPTACVSGEGCLARFSFADGSTVVIHTVDTAMPRCEMVDSRGQPETDMTAVSYALHDVVPHWRSRYSYVTNLSANAATLLPDYTVRVQASVAADSVANSLAHDARARVRCGPDSPECSPADATLLVVSAACRGTNGQPRICEDRFSVDLQRPFGVAFDFTVVDDDTHCIVSVSNLLAPNGGDVVIDPSSVSLALVKRPANDGAHPGGAFSVHQGSYPNSAVASRVLPSGGVHTFGFVIRQASSSGTAPRRSSAAASGRVEDPEVRLGFRYTAASVATLDNPVYNEYSSAGATFSPHTSMAFRGKLSVAWSDVSYRPEVPRHLRTFAVGNLVPWVLRLYCCARAEARARLAQRTCVLSIDCGPQWLYQGFQSRSFRIDGSPVTPALTPPARGMLDAGDSPPMLSGTARGGGGADDGIRGQHHQPDVVVHFATYAMEAGSLDMPRVSIVRQSSAATAEDAEEPLQFEIQYERTRVLVE